MYTNDVLVMKETIFCIILEITFMNVLFYGMTIVTLFMHAGAVCRFFFFYNFLMLLAVAMCILFHCEVMSSVEVWNAV